MELLDVYQRLKKGFIRTDQFFRDNPRVIRSRRIRREINRTSGNTVGTMDWKIKELEEYIRKISQNHPEVDLPF